MMKRLFAEKGSRWAEAEIELKDGRLSITGSEGFITTFASADSMARDYWEGFFEDQPAEMRRMGKRSPSAAAEVVLNADGRWHGLDVHKTDADRVYLLESCGQIRETLAEFFPQLAPLFPWHLNDMHAECEHQQARGESWTTHPSAVCPDCGYKLGSAWLKRELPADIVKAVEAL